MLRQEELSAVKVFEISHTFLNLKIDPHPYKGFSSQTLKTIVNQIKQIEGVRNFSPIGNVQLTKPY